MLAQRNPLGYNSMIVSFAHKGIEKFFLTGSKAGIQAIHANRLRLILGMLNEASHIDDMRTPALRLHSLQGELEQFWAVNVQANWRIIFQFKDGDAHLINYIDYH